MARRGPAPTPTPVLKLRGSTLATKRREQLEAKGPAGVPDCPDWLDEQTRQVWDQLVPLLEGMGVLTRVDGNALSRYCRLWTRWRKAEAFIDDKGEMYPLKDDKGAVKCFMQWPQVAIAHKLDAVVQTHVSAGRDCVAGRRWCVGARVPGGAGLIETLAGCGGRGFRL